MKNRSEIIVIGAGACGLMAAKELSGKGRQVTILEARDRTGGRIHTFSQHGFLQPVETGAEFIHGNLPVTLKLLKEAKIPYTKTEGNMLRNTGGHWQETDELTDKWDDLMKQMAKLKEDMTLTQFLNTHFSDEAYRDVKEQALQYAQGFDAVDPEKASVFALRNEWSHEEQATYRIEGGYQRLMDALVASCIEQNCFILLNKAVTGISWQKGEAIVTTVIGETFCAKQVIITIPAGVLQAGESEKGHIGFTPSLPQMQAAISNIGYGNVVKILLQFSACFWQEQKDALFFFSDQAITTWWTQQPASYPLLTGWIAGKKTSVFDKVSDDELLDKAVQSVAGIFNKSREEIRQTLTAYHIVNWKKDGYAKGAYSYSMIGSEDAKKVMSEPVENTLFFAGEALYSGMSDGTVEAALVQGLEVAKKVLKNQS